MYEIGFEYDGDVWCFEGLVVYLSLEQDIDLKDIYVIVSGIVGV